VTSFSEGGASSVTAAAAHVVDEGPQLPEVSKSPDRIAGMFDAIADKYDFLNHLLSAGIDGRWRRRAIRSLQLTGRERVLDLCTGTADLAIAARTARPPAARVVGIDFAGAMLGVARGKLRRRHLDASIALVRGDATRTPLADRAVDAVTIAFGIRNVENVEATCAEIRRVLRPGGRLAILEFAIPTMWGVRPAYLWYFNRLLPRIGRLVSRHGGAYGYLPASVGTFAPPEDFVRVLRQAGFTEVAANPLTFGIVFLYTARNGPCQGAEG
jgi:demethylmenaquinone methyltransferase/2-methoxy-6-polyprenyl-1,4-benzoquinol methylase